MIITEDYFLDAKKELEKYSNLLSILKLEVFCFCFVFMLVGLKKISYQFQNIFEIYSCEKKKEYYSASPNKNKPYFIHVYCI